MGLTVGQLVRTTPLEAIVLQGRSRSGRSGDVMDWLLYCAWKKIKGLKTVPAKKKVDLFRQVHKEINGAEIMVEA